MICLLIVSPAWSLSRTPGRCDFAGRVKVVKEFVEWPDSLLVVLWLSNHLGSLGNIGLKRRELLDLVDASDVEEGVVDCCKGLMSACSSCAVRCDGRV
jgi:hypothetical protein